MKYKVTVQTVEARPEDQYDCDLTKHIYEQTFSDLDVRRLVEFLNQPGLDAPAYADNPGV